MTKNKMSMINLFEFGTGMSSKGRQDPRTISIKRQLVSLIDSTDFDDNESVQRLRAAIEEVLRSL